MRDRLFGVLLDLVQGSHLGCGGGGGLEAVGTHSRERGSRGPHCGLSDMFSWQAPEYTVLS